MTFTDCNVVGFVNALPESLVKEKDPKEGTTSGA